MKIGKTLFVLVLFVASSSTSHCFADSPDIDYQAFLSQHDMIWDRVPNRWEVAPFTGNGNVGFLFYQAKGEAKNVISIYAGRHDYYDHREPHEGDELLWIYRSRLPLGHFNLTSRGDITGVDLRLDLWNAELVGTVSTTEGTYKVRGFTHSLHDVIYFETDATDESITITWHPDVPIAPVRTTLERGGGPKGGSWDKMRTAPYELPPEPTVTETDGTQFCFQPLFNQRGETTTGWRILGDGAKKQQLLASIHHSFPERDSLDRVERSLQEAEAYLAEGVFFASHQQWWNEYYPLSFLTLNDPEKEAFYWIQMYKFASATRGNGPVMDLMGPWYHDTFWPMVWGDLNVQLQYWTHLAANRLDVGSSLCNWFDKHEDQLFKNVPPHWQDSAGLATLFPQDLVAAQKATVPDMLCWIMHNYWLHCEFAGDRQRMRDGLFSKLRGVGNSYLNYLDDNPVASDDGKIHIKNSWSPEYPGGRGQDINFTIGLMQWCFQTLLDINREHDLDDPLADEWQNTVDQLVDFQIDENGLRIGKDIPFDKPHRHYSHLLPFYPLARLTPDSLEGKRLLRTSLDHWLNVTFNRKNEASAMAVTGYTTTGAASMYAWLGDSEKASEYLDFLIEHNRVSPTTMYAEGNPVIESPLSFATCIHDMLLQSWGGQLRVFPAVPESWPDVAFQNLRGQGAFLVSAKKNSGITQFVTIESRSGSPCVVHTDIAAPVIAIDGSRIDLTANEDGGYVVPLKRGETVSFTSVPLNQIELAIQPIPVSDQGRNLFGLSDKTTRLPGHQHYFPEAASAASIESRRVVATKPNHQVQDASPIGRFVRIELPGSQRILSLAEVEVLVAGKNIALHQEATQSTTVYGGEANRAVDGNTDGDYRHDSVTHTKTDGLNPWWEVDLASAVSIEAIRVHNRTGNSDRLGGFTVRVLDEKRETVFIKEDCPAAAVTEFVFDKADAASIGPTAGVWRVDSQTDWETNLASQSNLDFKDGMATPTATSGSFRSKLKRFDTKKNAKSFTIDQSPVWQNWEATNEIGPGCIFDSPVFLSLGKKKYWLFARHNRKAEQMAWESSKGPFVPQSVSVDGFDTDFETTPLPHQFRAAGGQNRSLGGYHAWESRNMIDWVHHGPITDTQSQWMTTAEYVDGKAYFYYDFPNDQDPHLIIDEDLRDGRVGQKMGLAFNDPSHGSDCAFIRDLEGNFHVIYEDWSPIHANSHSFDSPLAGHAVSKNGKSDFRILAPVIDHRTNPTGVFKTYRHPHWVKECPERFSSDLGKYEVHQPEQNAYGDWSSVCIGGRYYLFGDYDPAGSHGVKGSNMSIAWFTSSDLNAPFEFCDHIGQGHPDPDVCFAEGRFWIANQTESGYVSPGPWVDSVEARVGVDTSSDGTIDRWTNWTEVKESYDHLAGFSKQIAKTPAEIDLTELPAGYAFQFEVRLSDTTQNASKPILDKVTLRFQE